jgi:hypothetical protein
MLKEISSYESMRSSLINRKSYQNDVASKHKLQSIDSKTLTLLRDFHSLFISLIQSQ